MSGSREQILSDLRKNAPPLAPLPELTGQWIAYDDLAEKFCQVLGAVGGVGRAVTAGEVPEAIAKLEHEISARRTLSLVPAAAAGNVQLDRVASPHDLADLDLAVLPGELAVAENGAVWVTDRQLAHRVAYFLTQHLALVVPAANLVATMHAAYARLGGFDAPGFGAFISGPSKTADIEQALVIGAHGPRSLTVLLTV